MDKKTIFTVLLILEILIALSYASALVPLVYIFIGFGLVPLTLINMILAIVWSSSTKGFAIANFIISILGFIPIIGYLLRIMGLIFAILSAVDLAKKIK